MKKFTFSLSEKLVSFVYIFSLIFVSGNQSNGQSFEIKDILRSTNTQYINLFGKYKETNAPPNSASDSFTFHGNFQSSPVSVLDNDSDPDGDPLYVEIASVQTGLGTASFSYSGIALFSPNYGATGTTTAPYTVCDNQNNCSVGTVTFNVVNQPPVTSPDSYNVHDTLNTYPNLPGVLANDHDPEGDALSVIDLNGNYFSFQNSLGSGTINSNGHLQFTAAYGMTGSVTVQYPVRDQWGAQSTGSVTINVINQPPTAINDEYYFKANHFYVGIENPPPY